MHIVLILIMRMLIQLILMLADVVFMCVVFFSFTRSGFSDPLFGSLKRIGYNGYFWSATVNPDMNNAYDFDLNNLNFYPASYGARWYGFFTRCCSR